MTKAELAAMVAKASPAQKAELTKTAKAIKAKRPPAFVDKSFAAQTAFIEDVSRLKAVIGTRRSGKSIALVLLLLKTAWENPNTACLYIALTRDNAKKAIWAAGFKWYARQHPELNLDFNETELSVRLPNGSIIYLMGAESSSAVAERLRGGKFPLIVVDEAATFGPRLRSLYFDILKPATMDYLGTIALSGTPGFIKVGLFYDITKDDTTVRPSPGRWVAIDSETGSEWSVHRWGAAQNPYTADQAQTEIDEMIRNNPRIIETPGYIREWKGCWVKDDDHFVYRFDIDHNGMKQPLNQVLRAHYILGIDLGFNDPCAFVVGCWLDHDPHLYILEAYKQTGMIVPDMEKHIKAYRYRFETIIVDGANKQAVEDLRRRMNTPLQIAEKMDKAIHIEMMNSDFVTGIIQVDAPACKPLIEEYETLIWDPKETEKRIEMPGLDNHATDAALYLWRRARNYIQKPIIPKPLPGTQQAIADEHTQLWEGRMELNRQAAAKLRIIKSRSRYI